MSNNRTLPIKYISIEPPQPSSVVYMRRTPPPQSVLTPEIQQPIIRRLNLSTQSSSSFQPIQNNDDIEEEKSSQIKNNETEYPLVFQGEEYRCKKVRRGGKRLTKKKKIQHKRKHNRKSRRTLKK